MSKVKAIKENIQQVFSLGNAWAVKSATSKKFFLITDQKEEAINVARELAKSSGGLLVIYNKKGLVRSTKSYAVEPKTTPRKTKA